MVIDGKKIAEEILSKLKKLPHPKKFLAAFLVGDDSASESFLKQKEKTAKGLNVDFRIYRFPEKITQDKLRDEILKIVSHKTCGGAIAQLPLPARINAQYVLNAIPREKDIDALGERALGAFYTGRNLALPPAVGVVEEIIERFQQSERHSNTVNAIRTDEKIEEIWMNSERSDEFVGLDCLKVAVVGLGTLVGKPIASWLMGKAREVYLLDKGSDFGILKSADIIVCGVGVPELIKPDMLKNDTLVIDFGYGVIDGKISGDFDSSELTTYNLKLINYTPTPGGTGPILVAKLFENFYKLVLS